MIRTVEAMIDEHGSVRLLQPIETSGHHRALVTILDEEPHLGADEASSFRGLADGVALNPPDAIDWEQQRAVVASIRAFQAEMGRKYGVQPDSVDIIREMRDNPRA